MGGQGGLIWTRLWTADMVEIFDGMPRTVRSRQ
jgi:hypothetical protein